MAKNWAIAIGINHYFNLQPLKYAKRDAESMQDFFNEAGFDKVFLFTDDSEKILGSIPTQPTFGNLRGFLRRQFVPRVNEKPLLESGDNLWFFFAGHGIRHAERDYLMPCDVDPDDVEHTAISISFVSECLRCSGADNVILLLDACRNEGARDGLGIGYEQQQGVITIFSCSPNERAWEIESLQHGSFTYSLLEGLRIQGEGNCATVERLYHHLRYRVPEINRQFQKPRQTPYAIAEPATKYHLILLPRYATLKDAETLKNDALNAEVDKNFELAEQLWIQVLTVSPADLDAIKAIRRLAQFLVGPEPALANHSSRETSATSVSARSSSQNSGIKANQSLSLPVGLTRRRLLQLVGLTSAGAGTTFLIRAAFQPSAPKQGADASNSDSTPAPESRKKSLISTTPFEFNVVSVNAKGQPTKHSRKQAQYFTENLGNGVSLEMVAIPGGTFRMGSPETEAEQSNAESPQHSVTVKPFFMGKYPVTQAQWRTVASLPQVNRPLEPNPSYFKGDDRPVEQVSWYNAVEFCDRLSRLTKREYRLPSEAEWEYACRAGTTTPFHFGETITTDLANYNGNYTYGTGSKGKYREQTTPGYCWRIGGQTPHPFS